MLNIAIHSVPRSGSTWLGSIFDSHPNVTYKYQPLFSYALKGYLSAASSSDEIHSFFKKLEVTQDSFMDQIDAKKRGVVPEFYKSEIKAIVYKEVRYHHIVRNLLERTELKVVGLVRNPLSTIYSWWQAPKEFRADLGWKIEEEWLTASLKNNNKPEEFNGYLKWKEVALLFEDLREQYKDRFFLLTYDELLNYSELTIKNLFTFVGLNFPSETKDFLRKSKLSETQDSYGVYKIKDTDDLWKTHLPETIINFVIRDLKNTILEKYLE